MMLTSCLNESSQRAFDGPPHGVGIGMDFCDIGANTGRLGEGCMAAQQVLSL